MVEGKRISLFITLSAVSWKWFILSGTFERINSEQNLSMRSEILLLSLLYI